MNDIRTFTINEFNKYMHQSTLHPQVAVIDPMKLEDRDTLCFTGNFYAIRFVRTRCGEARYGRQYADFQYGTLVFSEPGTAIRIHCEDAVDGGISGILFCPELFSMKSLVFKKSDYTFFSYRENESLHLSLSEKCIAQDCLKHIHEELRRDIDRHSLRLVSAGVELLLDYCLRFYERQFACRTDSNRAYLAKLDKALESYFSSDGQKSADDAVRKAEAAFSTLSPAYLNDLVRAETGKKLSEYVRTKIIECIRKLVRQGGRPLEQVAEEFGFCQSRMLTLLYRQIFGRSPITYTSSTNYKLN